MNKLASLALLASAISWGGSVTLLSGVSAGASNNMTVNNVLITAIPEWATDPSASARWISYTNTGQGGTFIGSNPSTPAARFFQTFTIPTAGNFFGSVTVWADDTARI